MWEESSKKKKNDRIEWSASDTSGDDRPVSDNMKWENEKRMKKNKNGGGQKKKENKER